MVSDQVREFLRLGHPLPSEEDNSEEGDEAFEGMTQALHAIEKPVTNEEAALLIECFGDDECFGLAWTLLHIVESAPLSPVSSQPPDGSNVWIARLWMRYQNSMSD
ncbi:hypothetical protein OG787_31785 [Streptomyces sp. NBC_00075]|uniref:hypothetical protein n=1 Tax=Streptomyces sp. NBC_00075 TaxID=2975641 RepID=UPI00324939D0